MTERLSPKCLKLYNDACYNRNLPTYVTHLVKSLYNLDAILEEYEFHDETFSKEYTKVYKQWKSVERAFYNVLKRLTR